MNADLIFNFFLTSLRRTQSTTRFSRTNTVWQTLTCRSTGRFWVIWLFRSTSSSPGSSKTFYTPWLVTLHSMVTNVFIFNIHSLLDHSLFSSSQHRPCWSRRPFRVWWAWSPQEWGSARPVSTRRARTRWSPFWSSWMCFITRCFSTATTPSWSDRSSNSSSTSSALSHSTTYCCARTCAPGVKACRSGTDH